jgi:hypothetical protein
MPTGVHLSNGTIRTSANWELVLTGMAIISLAGCSAVVSYLVIWLLGQAVNAPTVPMLLGVGVPLTQMSAVWQAAINLITFFVFLVALRLSPLSGYHAAEHMTVTCIERFGWLDTDRVPDMPRAHPRCGTSLLTGILPIILIAIPLWSFWPYGMQYLITPLIVFLGWSVREQTGWFIQQHFTTKPPSPRQLEAGLRAGHRLLAAAERMQGVPTSPGHRLGQRGLPQMFAGVLVAMWLLQRILENLHVWLDHGL